MTITTVPGLMYNRFILTTETKVHRVEPDITVFEISGRLVLGDMLTSVESAIREIIDGGVRKLVIDLTRLNMIDSSGIGTLIKRLEQMDRLGGRICLAGAHGAVAKVFHTIRIDHLIALDADLASACARLSGSAASA
jgi:anti-anti-sigma factor